MIKPQDRYKKIFFVLGLILVLNWAVALAKVIYGWMSHSGSMFADGIHSFADGASNVIGMIGISLASQPADEDHPYGHKKYETFSALAIATFLIVICVFLIKDAVNMFYHPRIPKVTVFSFVVMVVTMAVNWGVTTYERKKGRELQSDILLSDALHTQTDILTSFSVIVSLIAVRFGFPMVDSFVTAFIAVFIGYAAFGIIKESSEVLCDHVVLDVSEIRKVVLAVDKIRSCHEIRTRGRKDDVYVDLHILVDNAMPVAEAHDLANYIEDEIKKNIEGVTDVVVHIEPESHSHSPNSPDKK
ncbi:MAG: cation transporter [Candidatus Omnitrophica bacterium]|nr:cation transporter [Candidatus Omnitrophota bacterium]